MSKLQWQVMLFVVSISLKYVYTIVESDGVCRAEGDEGLEGEGWALLLPNHRQVNVLTGSSSFVSHICQIRIICDIQIEFQANFFQDILSIS